MPYRSPPRRGVAPSRQTKSTPNYATSKHHTSTVAIVNLEKRGGGSRETGSQKSWDTGACHPIRKGVAGLAGVGERSQERVVDSTCNYTRAIDVDKSRTIYRAADQAIDGEQGRKGQHAINNDRIRRGWHLWRLCCAIPVYLASGVCKLGSKVIAQALSAVLQNMNQNQNHS